jgi:dihydrofolate synthase/folylpolyglutamate synthase
VRQAFAQVASPGRLEVVRTGPTVVLDATHNPAGMEATVEAVTESFGFTRLVAVVAAMADKDVDAMLELLEPVVEELVVTRNSSPRSMSPQELAARAESVFGADRVHVSDRLDDAIDIAVGLADQGDEFGSGVLITGSVVTAGDARILLKAEK